MKISLFFIVLQKYIKFNRLQRAQCAGDETQRSFFKLMNNALYGKSIENVGKRTDIRLLNDETKAYRLTDKPHCIDFKIFTENLFGIELTKVNQLINMPFHTGFSILDWSKLHMYRAYATLNDWYGPAIRLLNTNTDSLIIHVKSDDLYKEYS